MGYIGVCSAYLTALTRVNGLYCNNRHCMLLSCRSILYCRIYMDRNATVWSPIFHFSQCCVCHSLEKRPVRSRGNVSDQKAGHSQACYYNFLYNLLIIFAVQKVACSRGCQKSSDYVRLAVFRWIVRLNLSLMLFIKVALPS